MAFDFPSSPVQGDSFTDPASGAYYSWNGFAWSRRYSEPGSGATHPPAETIPVDPPIDGADNVNDVLVNLSNQVDQVTTDTGNKVDVAGDTMTGALILSEHPTALSPVLQAATKQYVDNIGAGLPLGGLPGEALVLDATGVPAWGAPINSGAFVTGALAVSKSGESLDYKRNDLPRWQLSFGDRDESADFRVRRFNDGGGKMGDAIVVSRKTGTVDFNEVPTVKGKKLVDERMLIGVVKHIEKLEAKINQLEKGKKR